ncbi:1-deoxy-D-xylulose-5-phosphate synthase N-terminal domain-containing protein [Alphaproteobacteria bacterium]|nr:transketolase [Alphaproteobacteria bacterium]MDC1023340.1 1-deoxy-D-xylulose-5-phosphate synthase N-terminal domain-containing protein [Alphaproteobacteria bacterium]
MNNKNNFLKIIEKRILWLSCWMVHNANHLRENQDGLKVGGHQASSASIVSIMTALYFNILRPEDRVAVKPHASPVFHAIQYLAGLQTKENIENFRGFGGAQSYPSRTKDIDDVDISTGSVGLGVAMTSFISLIQDYILRKKFAKDIPQGRMIALVGDAELDEGNVYECLQEGWKHDLRNVWWIIDYNRQSLDGVVHEGLAERLSSVFEAFGWNLIVLKYGKLQKEAFQEPGGNALKKWIDDCPNQLYSALVYEGGTVFKKRVLDDIGDQSVVSQLIDKRSDDEFLELMANLGGHCVPTLCETFENIKDNKPTAFIAYTIKGWGTPLAGHKDNHAGLMTKAQMDSFKIKFGINDGDEWNRFSDEKEYNKLDEYLKNLPFQKAGHRKYKSQKISVDENIFIKETKISTQNAFGKILDQYAKSDTEFSNRIVTTSPDVSVSTNLGPWINKKGLFNKNESSDTFRDRKIPSTQKWIFSTSGQHIELGIAEMNLFLMLGAAGLSHELFGERLFPIGTVYDPFISRGLDAMNYACYQDARFMIIGTPSGISLAPEGGAHQSIGTPLIGISQPGLLSFEPAFADELSAIMNYGFNYLQDENGGSIYLRLSTRSIDQPGRNLDQNLINHIVKGGYWLKKPGPNPEIIIVYQGVIANEVIQATANLGENFKDVGVLSITSSDNLFHEWKKKNISLNKEEIKSHIEYLLESIPRDTKLITVIDGHPMTLSWLGSVYGHKTLPLGVDRFGQTGNINELFKEFTIDSESISNLGLVNN